MLNERERTVSSRPSFRVRSLQVGSPAAPFEVDGFPVWLCRKLPLTDLFPCDWARSPDVWYRRSKALKILGIISPPPRPVLQVWKLMSRKQL